VKTSTGGRQDDRQQTYWFRVALEFVSYYFRECFCVKYKSYWVLESFCAQI